MTTQSLMNAGFFRAKNSRVASADIAATANSTFSSYALLPGVAYEITATQKGADGTNGEALEIELPDGATNKINWCWTAGPFRFIADEGQVSIQINNQASCTTAGVTIREVR